MNPFLDQLLVALVVASAIGWFVWRSVSRKRKAGCESGCGCSAPKKPADLLHTPRH